VIVPALPGYQQSSQPANGDYSLASLADDVVGWLHGIKVDRVHLIGHDWGAVVAYAAADGHPQRFRTATALAIPPLSPFDADNGADLSRCPHIDCHGCRDGCMDPRLFGETMRPDDLPSGVRHIEVADAGHFIHIERHALVNRMLIEHLST